MILRDIGIQLGLRGLALAIGFAAIALVPFTIPSDEYGRFALALTTCQLAAATLLSWPNQGTLRYGREEYAATGTLGACYAARLALHALLAVPAILLAIVGGRGAAPLLGLDGTMFALVLVAALLVLPLADLALVAAQTVGGFVRYGLGAVLVRLGPFAALAAIATGHLPARWEILAASAVAGSTVAAVVSGSAALRAILRGFHLTRASLDRLVAYGRLMPFANLAAFLLVAMDLWIINGLLGPAATGAYAWAYNLSLLATAILVPLAGLIAPRAIDARVAGDGPALARMARVFTALVALAITLMAPLVAALRAAAFAIDLGAFQPAIAPGLIIITATAFQLAMALGEPVMFAHERLVGRAVALMFVLAVVKAALGLALVPVIGIVGAAVATVAAFATGTLLQWHLLRRHLGLHDLARPELLVPAGLLPAVFAFAVPALDPIAAAAMAVCVAVGLGMASRQLGWFDGLADLVPAFAGAPIPVRRPATAILSRLSGRTV